MSRSMTVRADEVQPGDIATLVGYVVTVDRVTRHSTRRTRIGWKSQGMIIGGNAVLPHAEPVVIERPA